MCAPSAHIRIGVRSKLRRNRSSQEFLPYPSSGVLRCRCPASPINRPEPPGSFAFAAMTGSLSSTYTEAGWFS